MSFKKSSLLEMTQFSLNVVIKEFNFITQLHILHSNYR